MSGNAEISNFARFLPTFQEGRYAHRQSAGLSEQLAALETRLGQEPFVLDAIPAMVATSRPDFAAQCIELVQGRHRRAELQQRLSRAQQDAASIAVGRTVTIDALNPDQTPIIGQTYFSDTIIGRGGWVNTRGRLRRAVGTISSLDIARNTIIVKAQRYSAAKPNGPERYMVSVFGDDDSPLIAVEPREPSFRDKKGLADKFLDFVARAGQSK